MSRFANLPLAVRLGAAFGLLALALLLVDRCSAPRGVRDVHETRRQGLTARDVRAVSLAGKLGEDVQVDRPRSPPSTSTSTTAT